MATSTTLKVMIGLRILLGLAFVLAAVMKITGQPMMVSEFGIIGFGQWFRIFTGGIELLGALLLIRSSTVFFGAGLLLCVSIGAFFAQLLRLHGDVIHTIVFVALLAWMVVTYRPQSSRVPV